MMPQDRRDLPRADVAFQISYECFSSDGNKCAEGIAHTVNISGRGALIEMDRGVDLNGSMILFISSSFYTLVVKGDVVHSRLASDGLFHVGVKLTDVIEGNWDWLEKDVKGQMTDGEQ